MPTKTEARTKLSVSSPAFRNKGSIPTRFTCDAEDVSPPLKIGGVPAHAKTLALIMDDPDAPAGTWLHWLVWDLPATTKELPEDADIGRLGGREGKNTAGRVGYQGPCPPRGKHRYFLRVYALDSVLGLDDADRAGLEAALRGKVVAEGVLMGTYER